jgi:hypothetical protein
MKRLITFFVIVLLPITFVFPVNTSAFDYPHSAQRDKIEADIVTRTEMETSALMPGDYNIGSPTLTDLWVDPINGSDANGGLSRQNALRSLSAAWNRIPAGTILSSTGYRVQLVSGTYPDNLLPVYMEDRHGAYHFPIILQAADGAGTALLTGGLNIFNCEYLYLIGLNIVPDPAGDSIHFERCSNVLLHRILLNSNGAAQETFKANQCSNIYVEECDVSGSYGTALDFVAVQYGHILRSKFHNAGDWCMYLKGGSAYFNIEGNELYDGNTGGFTAGQGTGFEFMVSPWLHYETYDIKFVNNLIHDTGGAGMGVNGSYNILLAFNTLYRVGQRSHAIEVVYGLRGCDGNVSRCQANLTAGGWGTAETGIEEPIPNRNIFIYNNIIYNPPGYRSQWNHFAIFGPQTPSQGTNIPSPATTDTNLQIRGNIIFNGPPDLPLGAGEPGQGGQPSNPTCNVALILAQNAINTIQPQLTNPAAGDFSPTASSNILSYEAQPIPDFSWADAPDRPSVPAGQPANNVDSDFTGAPRTAPSHPGAIQGQSQSENKVATNTLVTSSANPSVFGQSVILTATVGVTILSGEIPTGTVAFKEGSTNLGRVILNSSSKAVLELNNLSVGTHIIIAEYSGNAGYFGSSSLAFNQLINSQNSPVISITSPPPAGVVNASFPSQTLRITGGTPVYRWSWKANPGSSLPPGLALKASPDTKSALISGIPSKAGTFKFSITAKDKKNLIGTLSLTITIYPALNIKVRGVASTFPRFPAACAGSYYTCSLVASGGSGLYTWSKGAGSPAWLSINPNTGVLSGMPATRGYYSGVNIIVRDNLGYSFIKSFSLRIN